MTEIRPDIATKLTMAALEAAYRGDLDTDWRTEFIGPQFVSGGGIVATLFLPPVAAALVGMDTQLWEPYASAGDWHRALDAWEFDYVALVDHYFRHYAGHERDRRAAVEHVIRLCRMMRAHVTTVPRNWTHLQEDTQ